MEDIKNTTKMSKERIITETPDKWVVLELKNEGTTMYKVFGSWPGGYLDGDREKGENYEVAVEEDDDYYYFIGYTGSCCKCHKESYGVMTTCQSLLDMFIDKANVMGASINVLLDDTNFMELLNQNKDE